MNSLLLLVSFLIPLMISCANTRSNIKELPVQAPSITDSDNDSIPDSDDKCPLTAGVAKYKGCPTAPDTDKDGINDEEDKCPEVIGVARFGGCPVQDTDNDGINDDEDKCPGEAGPARYGGCPDQDSDKDGVNDDEDKCPDDAGPANNSGCPILKSIFFERDTVFTKDSYKVLDEAVRLLKANNHLHLKIEGYTSGHDIYEGKRKVLADAVFRYMISKGCSADKLSRAYSTAIIPGSTQTPKSRVDLKFSE